MDSSYFCPHPNPLPKGEGVWLPLPLGEGWGEGKNLLMYSSTESPLNGTSSRYQK